MFIVKDFKGFSTYEKWFFGVFICLQCLIFFFPLFVGEEKRISLDGWLNLIASVSGVITVFMAAKGRLSTFFFGLIQVSTYGYLSFKQHFMGEVGMQIVFGIFQFIGIYFWIKNMSHDPNAEDTKVKEVDSRGLNVKTWALTIIGTGVVYALLVVLLQNLSGAFYAEHAYVDGASTALSIVGQILMTLRYKEQWLFWIFVNIISIILWWQALSDSLNTGDVSLGSVSMIVMWLAFLINSIYGYIQWHRNEKRQIA
ncbi:nicotinamide riboside transporter PnuC [Staphylococcus massiliensis]|uniref:nicotinamide riboside transporter PnuC n=1 Tax=Staphylococcus massiliensis TaxID=555791 RepID=UPI001EDE8775|nr:nicotinamide riboside transporter PnuC [Staphylococcus massiliensis]MCG3400120.1 nicotinamide riboside transporter PnuC [Staphylococcus massiliensis]MCG3413174.1 nicotinamide riboside transporter PnuC [Staphylococcus massiliensis]